MLPDSAMSSLCSAASCAKESDAISTHRSSVRTQKGISHLGMPIIPDTTLERHITSSVAAVQFSLVHGHISPNLELDHRFSSGKSPNPNLNLPERFFRSGSGFREVLNPNRTDTGDQHHSLRSQQKTARHPLRRSSNTQSSPTRPPTKYKSCSLRRPHSRLPPRR
jgi:hypothetical protein